MATKNTNQRAWQQVAGLSGVYALTEGRKADIQDCMSLEKLDQTLSKIKELRRELNSFAVSRGVKPKCSEAFVLSTKQPRSPDTLSPAESGRDGIRD